MHLWLNQDFLSGVSVAVPKKIGLIAGSGDLPLYFARQAKKAGYSLVTVAVKGAGSSALNSLSDSIQWVSIGQIGTLLSFFKRQGVRNLVLHGKVQHATLFKHFRLDWKTLSVWMGLKDRSGEGLLKGLVGELGKNGIKVLDARFLMKGLLAPRGLLTKTKPNREEEKTASYGLWKARSSAKTGIGQTILVKKNAVVAIEAMEGTDQATLRAGKISGPGVLLTKASSPKQDWRFDIPTIGPKTLKSLVRAKGRGIVLEAGRCFLLDREKLLAEADRHGIFVLSV